MGEYKISISAGGVFTFCLLVLFIGLKLTGYIDWPWIWVFAPLWIPILIVVALLVIFLIITLLLSNHRK